MSMRDKIVKALVGSMQSPRAAARQQAEFDAMHREYYANKPGGAQGALREFVDPSQPPRAPPVTLAPQPQFTPEGWRVEMGERISAANEADRVLRDFYDKVPR